MSRPSFIPTAPEVGREVLIVVLGAIGAALVIGALPGVRAWIKKQWDGLPVGGF